MEPDDWRALVGRHIELRRLEVGLKSMRAAATAAGVSESVWRQIETGRRILAPNVVVAPTPNMSTKYSVAKALRWEPHAVDRLMNGRDPTNSDLETPEEPPSGHSAWWPRQADDPPSSQDEQVNIALSDVMTFLTTEQKEHLTEIAQTFARRRSVASTPLTVAADGDRDRATEPEVVASIDKARKKASPRRTT